MSDTDHPVERLARVDRIVAECRMRNYVSPADLQAIRDELAAVVEEHADLSARLSQALAGGDRASFMSIREVAGLARTSNMTINRMVHAGELASVRVGRSFRIPKYAVRKMLGDDAVDAFEAAGRG